MPTNKIKTIIFDVGGVLLPGVNHWFPNWQNRIKRILLAKGFSEKDVEFAVNTALQFDKNFLTNNFIENWQQEKLFKQQYYAVISENLPQATPDLAEELLFLTFNIRENSLFGDVIETLEILHENYRLGILSNALPGMNWTLDYLEIRKYFHSIIISADVKLSKPDPAIYHLALTKLEAKSEECLFIDDSQENILAAEKVGMQSFLFNRKQNKDTLLSFVQNKIGCRS